MLYVYSFTDASDLLAGEEFKRSLLFDSDELKAVRILDWRSSGDGDEFQLLIEWDGYGDQLTTWEPISKLISLNPGIVKKYIAENAENAPDQFEKMKNLFESLRSRFR